ncbi:Putative multidrug export ATP-binding/permease protein [bacterium HR26]|nr:Putative multidrug export ATP-binding/permease protein [bacterium HR26]
MVNPLLIRVVFDEALFCGSGCPDLDLLVRLVALMAAVPIIGGAIGVGQTYLANRVGQRVMQDLRDRLYTHLQRMSLRFFTATRTGEIQSRLANDVGGVQSVVTDTAATVLANVVIVISTLVAMLVISWPLTVLSLLLTPLFVWLTYRVGKTRRQVVEVTQQSKAEMSAITQETLSVSGVLLAKVFGRQQDEIERFRRENRRLAELQVRQQMIGQGFFAVVQAFFSITPALVYLVAGYLLASGRGPEVSAGTLVAFTTLQTRLFFPVGQLLRVSVEVQSSLALFRRIFDYLDLTPEIVDAPDAVALPAESVRGQIRFRHVYFTYGEAHLSPSLAAAEGNGRRPPEPDGRHDELPRRPWILEDVDFEIEPGQLVALVGPSGAGKTTISYLIPRLYDVTAGTVEIDGVDVRKIQIASLTRLIGMVTQEPYLFHASVRENLLYAKPDATQEEIERAAKLALIHDRIMELDQGYDTIVGERGYRMSGGEKQRLAIARVILKDPRILILDEATSSLDTASERLVQRALQPVMAGRTTIAIAHRLSTILNADVIFVIDRGRIVERGTHRELLERGGLYAQLYRQQFGEGLIEARCQDGLVLASGHVIAGEA